MASPGRDLPIRGSPAAIHGNLRTTSRAVAQKPSAEVRGCETWNGVLRGGERIRSSDLRILRGRDRFSSARSTDPWVSRGDAAEPANVDLRMQGLGAGGRRGVVNPIRASPPDPLSETRTHHRDAVREKEYPNQSSTEFSEDSRLSSTQEWL